MEADQTDLAILSLLKRHSKMKWKEIGESFIKRVRRLEAESGKWSGKESSKDIPYRLID
ncbi:hypothetical protein P4U97_13645 [Bacillus swezeyi]|uniref:hypothetical protein n=1 Tax=Bacillus swezeyi TaxID=1925020 RepID=UPI002E23256A|nr:hypothetical protein [Bacillus swezeyi]